MHEISMTENNIPNLPVVSPGLLPTPSGVDGLDRYIQYTNSIPLLTREEEYELSRQLNEENNLQSAQRLVLSHLRYVVRIAKGYMGYGLSLADLIQEGTIGLMKAVKKFKPEKEVRLVTFAMHWIKAEIHEFVIKNWRIVKIATTKSQRKLFFKLRSKKKDSTWLTAQEISEIAKDLGVKEKDVIQMEARMAYADTSFDLPSDDEDSDKLAYSPVEYLEHNSAGPDQILEQEVWQSRVGGELEQALQKLDPRSLYIVQQRWLTEDHKATLEDLATKFAVSKERIRQIEARAISQIKDLMVVTEE